MSELHPCPGCQRHIRSDEAACPFCDQVAKAPEPRRLPRGRFTRAAVFAGALAGSAALVGCGSSTPKPEDTNTTGGGGDVTNGGGDLPTMADAGAVETEGPDDIKESDRVPDHDIPMPYGAPPARSRLV